MEQYIPMPVYALPAAIALLFKMYYLFRVNVRTTLDKYFTALCLAMVAQNCIEVCAYTLSSTSMQLTYIAADLYLCATYLMLATIILFSLSVINYSNPKAIAVILLFPITLSVMHFNGLIVLGWNTLGEQAVASIPGEYYWAFRVFLIASIIFSLCLLFWASRNKDPIIKNRAKISFIGLLPLSISMLVIIIMKALGYTVSSAMILPFGTLFFLGAAAFSTKNDLLDIAGLAVIRIKIVKNLLFKTDEQPLTELVDNYELALLMRGFKRSNGTQVDMARILKVSESLITRRMQKYGLKKHALSDGTFILKSPDSKPKDKKDYSDYLTR